MELNELKNMLNVSEVVGKPIEIDKYTTAVPVMKVSYGYVGADSDFNGRAQMEKKNQVDIKGFGMTVTPLGILVCGEKTSYIRVDETHTEDKWLSLLKSIMTTFQKKQ